MSCNCNFNCCLQSTNNVSSLHPSTSGSSSNAYLKSGPPTMARDLKPSELAAHEGENLRPSSPTPFSINVMAPPNLLMSPSIIYPFNPEITTEVAVKVTNIANEFFTPPHEVEGVIQQNITSGPLATPLPSTVNDSKDP